MCYNYFERLMQNQERPEGEEVGIEERLNVHMQHSDLALDSKQRAYSEADEIVVGPVNNVYAADANKSVERCNHIIDLILL